MRLSRAPKSGHLPEPDADAPLPLRATGTVGESNSRKRRANASRSLADSAFNCSISAVTLIRHNYNVYPRETSRKGPCRSRDAVRTSANFRCPYGTFCGEWPNLVVEPEGVMKLLSVRF